ncbi:hypothetical protein KJS94_12675 [Flavihumibacter rivuli]|uniref:hypothetical protein n=1 Tax=Flavihumibacter rivuli TaxID=2838156 RepID=UPI001BDF4799|nr:hypothetical protein [Flavihumibacter rivuli]ULQ55498.1 hypothetical protein KJS94_12675 [Flavihumibacter rivuli]
MPTIYVSRNGQSLNLKLRDNQGHNPGNSNLTTDVDPDDQVIWELDEDSGLSELVGVEYSPPGTNPKYNNSVNFFAAPPQKQGDVIVGHIVGQSPGKGARLNYKIQFKIPGDSRTHEEDPKLQMNS